MNRTDAVTQADFRGFFAASPTPVAIVTSVDANGEPRGMTCNSVSSVSLDPPMLLVCLGRLSRTLRAVEATGSFAVNYLAADQAAVAVRFGAPGPDKFVGVRVAEAETRCTAPILEDAATAWALCEVHRAVPAGDHTVVIGEIRRIGITGRAPLLYFDRGYLNWASPEAPSTPPARHPGWTL